MKTTLSVRSLTPLALALGLIGVARRATADVVIPSTAYSSGANAAEFHSDVRIFNPSTTSPVLVTPVFYQSDASGNVVNTVTATAFAVAPRTQVAYDNVLSSLFGQAKGVFGPVRLEAAAPLIVSSGVNNVNACGSGAISGQWLPGIDTATALTAGTLVQLGASANSATGYRTNVDLMNPGTSTANVTVKVHKGDGTQISSNTIAVPANGLFQRRLDDASTFPGVAGTTDTNLWVEFTSDQPVLVFASVINNASGDPFAIVMTPEPGATATAPVANYTVSASPAAGQPVTFTDTSTGSPTNRFWVFGDGAVASNPSAPVQHTYGSAGTYHTALFVDNAAGASSITQDVVVGAAAPIAVSILATTTGGTRWTFVCQSPANVCSGAGNNNAKLHVGQPYTITFTTPASEAKTHGVGGEAASFLGVSCDVVTPSMPCTVNLTPTTAMLTFLAGGVYPYACTQATCAPTLSLHQGMTGTITIVH